MRELDGWSEEMRSAYLYRVVSARERGTSRAALFEELAGQAETQAAIWARLARAKGTSVPASYAPDRRAALVAWLVTRFGVYPMRHVLTAAKVRGMSLYLFPAKSAHQIPSTVSDIGRRHRAAGGSGNLRASVFGVNDGLISNASLIMGLAGAGAAADAIVLTGIAGLAAGAFSMAAGEYVSVRSQREVFEYQIGLEREELLEYPEQEAAELALIYEAKGVEREEARRIATALIADPEKALDTLAREELGLNPDDLGSPWGAALFSFASFAVGATVPLLPFLFTSGGRALTAAVGVSLVALFAVGGVLSLFTGRGAFKSGLRMMSIGALAGGVTYLVGSLVGASV